MSKKKRRATPEWLERSFDAYLGRYETNSYHARRIMKRRIDKKLYKAEGDRDELLEHLEKLIAKYQRLRIIDDRRYARGQVRRMLKRGNSARKIRAKLQSRGLDSTIIDEALTDQRQELGVSELSAAARYARRRRLGPYRRREIEDAERKDLGKLARAGYSYRIARQIVDCESEEALREIEERDQGM